MSKETEKEKQQRLIEEQLQKYNNKVKLIKDEINKEKDYEYYARFPFDLYQRYNDMGLDKRYLPTGWLIDHELTDINNGVYYSDIFKEVVYVVRGTDFSRIQDWITVSLITLFGYSKATEFDSNFITTASMIIKKYIDKKYDIIFSSHSAGASLQMGLMDYLYKKDTTDKYYPFIKKIYAFNPGVSLLDNITTRTDMRIYSPNRKSKTYIYYVKGDIVSSNVNLLDDKLVNMIEVKRKVIEEAVVVGAPHNLNNFLSDKFLENNNIKIDYRIMAPKSQSGWRADQFQPKAGQYPEKPFMSKKQKAQAKKKLYEQPISTEGLINPLTSEQPTSKAIPIIQPISTEEMFISEQPISNKEKQTTTESKVKQAIAEKKFKTVEEKFARHEKNEGNKDLAKGLVKYRLSQGVDLAPKIYDTSTQEKYEAYEKVRKAGTLKKEMKDGKLQYVKEEQIGEDSHLILKFEPMRKDKMKSNIIQTVKKIAPKIPTPVGAKKETKIGKPKEKIVKKIQRVKKTFKIQ